MTEPTLSECVIRTGGNKVSYSHGPEPLYRCNSDIIITAKATDSNIQYRPSKEGIEWSLVQNVLVVQKTQFTKIPTFYVKSQADGCDVRNCVSEESDCNRKPNLLRKQIESVCQALNLLVTDQDLLTMAVEDNCPSIQYHLKVTFACLKLNMTIKFGIYFSILKMNRSFI